MAYWVARRRRGFVENESRWPADKSPEQAPVVVQEASFYRHIELDVLLSIIFRKLRAHGVDGIRLQISDLSVNCAIGLQVQGSFTLNFALQNNTKLPGRLTLYSGERYRSCQVLTLETLIENFKGPLNNAVLYKRACHVAYHDT